MNNSVTPEFIDEKNGKFILVHNHGLDPRENVTLSIAFTMARIEQMHQNLPEHLETAHVVYDLSGQVIAQKVIQLLRKKLSPICKLELKAN